MRCVGFGRRLSRRIWAEEFGLAQGDGVPVSSRFSVLYLGHDSPTN